MKLSIHHPKALAYILTIAITLSLILSPKLIFLLANAYGATSGIGGGDIYGDCSANTRNLPIYRVDTDKPDVALTFDAAWGASDTVKILNILDKHQVKVAFFLTGSWVEQHPDMVKLIRERGHDIGNHSQNHKEMSKLSRTNQQQEILQVSERIYELTGYTCFLFRPPYGDYNNALIDTCYGLNHYPIQWSVDSLDWKDYGVDSIIKTVTEHKSLGNGSIILMHNGATYTPAALDSVITTLKAKGYNLIPLSELIIRQNFRMDTTGCQHPSL